MRTVRQATPEEIERYETERRERRGARGTAVLYNGRVLRMSNAEMRREGVLGGPRWDVQRDDVMVMRSHERVLQDMDIDGRLFHQKVSAHSRTSTGEAVIDGAEPGDEISFDELFEQQEYWS